MQVKAFGMIINDPHRVHYALYELGKYFKLPKNIDGYGVATSANDSVLLTRAPGRVEDNCLASLIGPLEGGCSVGQFRHKSDIRPFKASMSSANLGPYRYGNMAGVVTGGPENADKLGENRRNLLGILPDNFRKMVSGRTESEAFFYAVLSSLRSDFRLLEKKTQVKNIKEAVESVLKLLGEDRSESSSKRAILISLGSDVIIYQKNLCVSCANIKNLNEDLVNQNWQKQMGLSKASKEQIEQFKGIFAFIGEKSDFQESTSNNQKCLWLNSEFSVSAV